MNVANENERKLTDDKLFVLLQDAQRGDSSAQDAFFDAYETELLIAIRVRRTPLHRKIEETMDVCNSVVRRLISNWEKWSFPEFGAFRGTVRTIVERRIKRAIQRFMAEKEASEAAALLHGDSDNPQPKIESYEFVQFIRSKMTASEQAIFDAIHSKGMTYVELSKQYPVSASALRKQLSRAMERVTEELDLDEE
ncbi:RNA polymerase sigma factor [Rubinisphaera italica]|uniref:RNA polymerase sigma factor n=1 Tax=Rubinisphaera italica TaxID=2527969 RepID=A0A5C5XEZ5_9PLAN|nr:sigma-70 family RNA polymerase sigma factor [Rubinisphaera italica]TWT61656.1 RNA polymerase sigma factor [Rubinisphaera italica]